MTRIAKVLLGIAAALVAAVGLALLLDGPALLRAAAAIVW